MNNIVILTGSELRHEFFRKYLGSMGSIHVLQSFCESEDANLKSQVEKQETNALRSKHLLMREQTEKDFFQLYCQQVPDASRPVFLKRGDINLPAYVEQIKGLNPDIIIAYGCSIIKPPLIEAFGKRFINVHLGLSPYYRGSGTNYWPFVNNEIEYVGVTFMHIDTGIDTGEIIHQIRPRVFAGDNVHTIGNRLILDMASTAASLIERFDALENMQPIAFDTAHEKHYRAKDFTEASLETMYSNFSGGMIDHYLANAERLQAHCLIIHNPAIT